MGKVFYISIYVPVKGTTEKLTQAKDKVKISIHVPAKGTTGNTRKP